MNPSQLAKALTKGLKARHRPATEKVREAYGVLGRDGKAVVAEVLVNKGNVRVSWKSAIPKAATAGFAGALKQGAPGKGSSQWAGAIIVTEENQAEGRAALEAAVVAEPQPEPEVKTRQRVPGDEKGRSTTKRVKAKDLVEAGLAEDIIDATAQIADMGAVAA